MRPERSKEFTTQLKKSALTLLRLAVFRKPDDLARRFGLPLAVVRYWWRNSDQEIQPIAQNKMTTKAVKMIRSASQALEGWEKIKRYRARCGATLVNGRKCKLPVAIRAPEGWDSGCLADRCHRHGGLSRSVRNKNS